MCVASLYYVVAELSEKVKFYINYFSDTLGWYGGSASRPAPGGVVHQIRGPGTQV